MEQPLRNREARQREEQARAQATLDRLRHQAGGALDGAEVARRDGRDPTDLSPPPPLDWRPTPRNLALQALAILAFVGAVWFLGSLLVDSWGALLERPAAEGVR